MKEFKSGAHVLTRYGTRVHIVAVSTDTHIGLTQHVRFYCGRTARKETTKEAFGNDPICRDCWRALFQAVRHLHPTDELPEGGKP